MQNNRKEENEETSNVEREDRNIEKIADEAANKSADETLRQVLRGDESRGDADERDVVGSSASIDTPQGREEAKNNQGSDS